MGIEGHTNSLKISYAIFGMDLIPRENFTAEKFTPENPNVFVFSLLQLYYKTKPIDTRLLIKN